MKRTEELFSLIHSLDKHEKRFFKLSASIESGEKQYMQMFDIIAGQSVYDEKEIIGTLRISKNLLAFQKNYLQRLILNRIAFLHSTKKTDVLFLLKQAEILKNKGLYPQHLKTLKKIKEVAHEFDMHGSLLEVAGIEHSLAWKDQRHDDAAKAIEEKKKIIERLTLEAEYHSLANEIITKLARLGNENKPEVIKQLKKLVKNPLMKVEKNAVTFRCKNYLYHTLSLYYSVAGSPKKQYLYAKKNADLFSSNPEKAKHFTMIHVFAIHNLVAACNAVKKYDEAKKNLDILIKSSQLLPSEREKMWAFFTFYDNSFDYYINTGQFKEGVVFADQHMEAINKHAEKLDAIQNIQLCYLIAKIYFGAANYSKCIEWMNKVRQHEPELRLRPDLEVNTKLFYIIAHFEKGNSDLLPYLSKSLHRHLRTEKRLYKVETIVLDFFGKRILKADSKKEIADELKKLKKELLILADDTYESAPMKEFDYISWIDSKLENKSFAEIVKRKALA